MTEQIIGWRLDERDRQTLLRRFPPRYVNIVADHITFGRADRDLTLPEIPVAEIVGRADDGEGVEALVAELAGRTDRPTGGTYHITWSLGDGREAIESNRMIGERGWEPVGESSAVRLEAARWP